MFYDTDGNPLTAAALDIRSEQEKTFSVLIDCSSHNLRAETVPLLAVLARHTSQPAFTDIEVNPLPLAAWNGNRELFIIKLIAGVIDSASEAAFNLKVQP